ncbi:MAG: hypothetical protein JWR26_3818 [Pedosphaera sp.]|nr:hypothetical protein [Pedosphaera sp.]
MDSRCPTPLFITGGMNIEKSSWCVEEEGTFNSPPSLRSYGVALCKRKGVSAKRRLCCEVGFGFSWALDEVAVLADGHHAPGDGRCPLQPAVALRELWRGTLQKKMAFQQSGGWRRFLRTVTRHKATLLEEDKQTQKMGHFFRKKVPIIRLPSPSVGFRRVGRGFDFFHGVLADGHHLEGAPWPAVAQKLWRGVLQDWQGRYWQNGRGI